MQLQPFLLKDAAVRLEMTGLVHLGKLERVKICVPIVVVFVFLLLQPASHPIRDRGEQGFDTALEDVVRNYQRPQQAIGQCPSEGDRHKQGRIHPLAH